MAIDAIPENYRDIARAALAEAFGSGKEALVYPIVGGASGALTYRIEVNGSPYLMRLETRRGPLRNPHQYSCMKIAADAGIAPPLLHVNDSAGIAIVNFIEPRPLSDYPGGSIGLAAAIGKLIAQLQETSTFPELGDYRVTLERMLGYLQRLFVPGLLKPHVEAFERIRAAYPWDSGRQVSSHNDLNPGNILFDGRRLWLIDWETSYRNHSTIDIAILTENFAPTPELEEALLTAWLGRQADRPQRARLRLMRKLTRVYYAGLLFATSVKAPGAEPINDLAAPTAAEFRTLVESGRIQPTSVEAKTLMGKMMLAGFLYETETESFERTLEESR